MLKLEKIAKTRDLSVILRAKPSLLSRTFLCAFFYAIVIHLIALFVFPIVPFKIKYQESIFPPVIVASEAPSHLLVYGIDFLNGYKMPIPAYLTGPAAEMPELPPVAAKSLERKMEYIKHRSLFNNPFLALEEHLETEDIAANLSEALPNRTVIVKVSGTAAELAFQHPIDFEEEIRGLGKDFMRSIYRESKVKDHRFHYSINVDKNSGELFWWELIGAEGSPKLQQHTVNIMKNIRFQKDAFPGIFSGEIEITIRLPIEGQVL